MIYLRAEFRRHMCDDALDIRMQPKSKGKSRTPDILLIYILIRNIFIKNGARVVQLVMTGLRTWWYGIRIPVATRYFFFTQKFSDRLRGSSNL
jgi:hypothetical protein